MMTTNHPDVMPRSAAPRSNNSLLGRVADGFRSLQGSPSELWKAYTLKFLDSFSYFAFSLIFTLFLSADFGYTDVQAGTIYGAWGALITIYGLLAGFIIDNLGVATS
jgi:dipeptide/tripeptide permease